MKLVYVDWSLLDAKKGQEALTKPWVYEFFAELDGLPEKSSSLLDLLKANLTRGPKPLMLAEHPGYSNSIERLLNAYNEIENQAIRSGFMRFVNGAKELVCPYQALFHYHPTTMETLVKGMCHIMGRNIGDTVMIPHLHANTVEVITRVAALTYFMKVFYAFPSSRIRNSVAVAVVQAESGMSGHLDHMILFVPRLTVDFTEVDADWAKRLLKEAMDKFNLLELELGLTVSEFPWRSFDQWYSAQP